MFLTYGRDDHGALIHVTAAPRGDACGLRCPFCGGPLTARKGRLVTHHFAHRAETCRPAASLTAALFPSYEGFFTLGLTPAQRQTLAALLEQHGAGAFYADDLRRPLREALADKGFLRLRPEGNGRGYWRTAARLTEKARAFAAKLTLAEFAGLMEAEFRRAWRQAAALPGGEAAAARELLGREAGRLETTTLYFLELETGDGRLHKIGVTARDVAERIAEVEAFARRRVALRQLAALHVIPGAAVVEPYFKARFAAWQQPLGRATEYFAFADVGAVRAELAALAGRRLRFAAPRGEAAAAGAAARPRFRGVVRRVEQRWNDFRGEYEPMLVLGGVTNLLSGDAFAPEVTFAYGKTWAAVGELWQGDVVEFNAAVEGARLLRPTRVGVVR